MTTIIDHAINIPAPTQIVWALISNPEHFPRWQSDCQRVAFLTTQRRGKNTRLRCMGDSGKEYVMEISAWYEGLGYEYKIIDGGPYETNQGRLRLQEIAEGTVVQWTFSYSMAGVLGSLRNMGVRRSAENQVIDSLRNLYRFVRDSAGENNIKVVKSMMQDAPDVDQRATYTPRHPSQYNEDKLRQTGSTARPVPVQRTSVRPIIDEPLPADDDTQRNRPVTPAASSPVEMPPVRPTGTQPPVAPNYSRPINAPEPRPATSPTRPPVDPQPPTILTRPTADPRPPTETRRDYSTTIPPVPQPQQPAPTYKPEVRPAAYSPTEQYSSPSTETTERPDLPPVDTPRPPTPPAPLPRVDVNPMTTPPPVGMRPPAPPTNTTMPPTIAARPSTTSMPPVTSDTGPLTPRQEPPAAPPREKASITDTGRMSVFELFGLPKPSETQQMKAVDLSLPKDVAAATSPRVERVEPVSGPVLPPEPPVMGDDTNAARAAFQAGMPQTGDVTPEPEVRQGWRALHRRQMLALRRPIKPQ